MRSTIFFVALTVIMLAMVGNLLRSRRIRERYAVLWVTVGLLMLVLVAFPSLLDRLAHLVGIAVPSNLLFVLAIGMLLGVTLQLTLEVSRAEDRNRVLAENIAILNLEVRQLQHDCSEAHEEAKTTGNNEATPGKTETSDDR